MEHGSYIYQCMEGRDGEDTQTAHRQFGGTRCKGQEPFGVGKLSPLQTGQVTSVAEQIHVKLLQVLLPEEDLQNLEETTAHPVICASRLLFVQHGASLS